MPYFPFHNRKLIIATKHGKESVIGPNLELGLKVSIVPQEYFETDQFGTFTGEIPRLLSPTDALRAKCKLAHEISGHSLLVATEGSFGPHPIIPFTAAHEEFMMLKDTENGNEIIARILTTETNFKSATLQNESELLHFSQDIGFPSHGLILKSESTQPNCIKGIWDEHLLINTYRELSASSAKVVVETDMRAMFNPTRMRIIDSLCHELIKKTQQLCPECTTPGYDIVNIITGLPCEDCGAPTQSIMTHQKQCKICRYSTEESFPTGKFTEKAMYCSFCNP